jgi:hypothetical protein
MQSQIREILRAFSVQALTVSALAMVFPLFNWAGANDQILTCTEMEEFLRFGKIVAQKSIPKGVTLPQRATLEYKGMKHDAAIQTVDISRTEFKTALITELNFRDSWRYNVAGYKLAKMLELNMVPPYVERQVGGHDASLSWWVDESMMELDRMHRTLERRT